MRDLAHQVITHPDYPETFRRYFLSLVEEPDQAVLGYHDVLKAVRRAVGRLRPPYDGPVPRYVMLYAVNEWLARRGRRR